MQICEIRLFIFPDLLLSMQTSTMPPQGLGLRTGLYSNAPALPRYSVVKRGPGDSVAWFFKNIFMPSIFFELYKSKCSSC